MARKERRSHFPRGWGPKLTTNLLVAQEPFDYFEPTAAAIEEALTLASQADKVVVALGETDWMSGKLPVAVIFVYPKTISGSYKLLRKIPMLLSRSTVAGP